MAIPDPATPRPTVDEAPYDEIGGAAEIDGGAFQFGDKEPEFPIRIGEIPWPAAGLPAAHRAVQPDRHRAGAHRCARGGQVTAGLTELGDALRLRAHDDDSEAMVRKVRRWLETWAPEHSLVVFDNAVSADLLAPLLPVSGHAQVVITSNHH